MNIFIEKICTKLLPQNAVDGTKDETEDHDEGGDTDDDREQPEPTGTNTRKIILQNLKQSITLYQF